MLQPTIPRRPAVFSGQRTECYALKRFGSIVVWGQRKARRGTKGVGLHNYPGFHRRVIWIEPLRGFIELF